MGSRLGSGWLGRRHLQSMASPTVMDVSSVILETSCHGFEPHVSDGGFSRMRKEDGSR